VRNVIDASQATQNIYDTYAFGDDLGTQTSTVSNLFRYTSRDYDSWQGPMYYMRNRYYHPNIGAFASRDAIWADWERRWGYAQNHPLDVSDPYGLDWFDDATNFVAGMGDNLTFGGTNWLRGKLGWNSQVNRCSIAYKGGEWAGTGLSLAIGVAGGVKAAGVKTLGKEFSHWLPDRLGGPVTILNGNYVSAARHYAHDPFRFPIGWSRFGPKLNPVLQQWDRIPNVIKGAGAGTAYGLLSQASNCRNECGCQSPADCSPARVGSEDYGLSW